MHLWRSLGLIYEQYCGLFYFKLKKNYLYMEDDYLLEDEDDIYEDLTTKLA